MMMVIYLKNLIKRTFGLLLVEVQYSDRYFDPLSFKTRFLSNAYRFEKKNQREREREVEKINNPNVP